jgi:Mg-chelatase subunit ChlI
VLDNRNTAAIFNAAAMAAGGGEGIEFVEDAEKAALQTARKRAAQSARPESPLLGEDGPSKSETVADARKRSDPKPNVSKPNDDDSENTSPSNSGAEASEDDGERQQEGDHQNEEVWSGSLSAVVGLQKRGLRGLMEGRRIREGSRDATTPGNSVDRVGLGIEKG